MCCLDESEKLASSKGTTVPTATSSPRAISRKPNSTNISAKKPSTLSIPPKSAPNKPKPNPAQISQKGKEQHPISDLKIDNISDNKLIYESDKLEDDDLITPTNDCSNKHISISLAAAAALKKAAISSSSSSFAKCQELLRKSQLRGCNSGCESSTRTFTRPLPTSRSISSLKDNALREDKGSLTDINSGPGGLSCTSFNSKSCEHELSEGEHQDEVEIVSLLEEEIPKYKLRADTITKFTGYPNEDFVGIPYPVLTDFSPVTPEQAYLTLSYFLLSGERVSQMTKTYADVDALQRLLEEKEKDLELAARIGQQLLDENRGIRDRLTLLENESRESQETITQLKHELTFKTELLELYKDENCPPSEEQSKATTPICSMSNILERRVAMLEEENQFLRVETCKLAESVEKTEADEKYLVDDAIKRLSETNSRVTRISNDLEKKCEENAAQQDEILYLSEEIKVLKEINKEIFDDNTQLHKFVEDLKSRQNNLNLELMDLKDNYIEVVAILKETQEQLREAQKQRESGIDVVSVFDSLAYEIESSVAKQRRSSDYFRRCFDTVRCVNSKQHHQNSADSSLVSNSSQLLNSSMSSGYHSTCSGLRSIESSHETNSLMPQTSNAVATSPSMDAGCSSRSSTSLGILSPGSMTPSDKYSWRLPERLQIVKPLEGSSTLQVWTHLATPTLGNLLDRRPGVHSRVEKSLRDIKMVSLTEGPSHTSEPRFVSTSSGTFTTNPDFNSSQGQATSSTTVIQAMTHSVSSPQCNNSRVEADAESNKCLKYASGDYLKCETPQNSPDPGTSRSESPTAMKDEAHSKTFQTLYNVYDTLIGKLGGLGGSSQSLKTSGYERPKTSYNLAAKIGDLDAAFSEKDRSQAPARPGSGAMDKIMRESLK